MNRWAVVETQENVPLSVRWAESLSVAMATASMLAEHRFGAALRLGWRQGLEEVGYYEHGLYRVQAVEVANYLHEPSPVGLVVSLYDASGQRVEESDKLLPADAADFAARFLYLHGTDPDGGGAGAQPGSIKFRPVIAGVRRYEVDVELAMETDPDGRKYKDTVVVAADSKKAAAARARGVNGPVADRWPGPKNVRVLSVREVPRGDDE